MNESFHELTDSQWQIIEKLLDDKRQRWHSLRTIINAILWLNYTGLQWRELSKMTGPELPWQSVYYHFRQFKLKGVWEQILDSLVIKERKRQGRHATPSLVAIDSQSVRIMQFIEEQTGIDGNTCINGRKRSIAVDRLGLPWSLAVTSANTSDNEAGKLVVDRLRGKVPRLKVVAADHGYKPGRRFGYLLNTEKQAFVEHQSQVIFAAKPRKGMAKADWPLAAKAWAQKRSLIETVIGQSKAVCNLEHTRHRSASNAFVNIYASLVAYSFYERKPVARVDLSDRLRMAGEPNWALAA